MNEEPTKDLRGRKSFEDRVFVRFDSIDARFDAVDTRLEKLESRSYDTKPIWEQALKAIMDTRSEVIDVRNRITVIETAVGVLKTDVGELKTNYGSLRNEFVDIRRELRENVRQELALILKFLIEDRQDIRDAEDRVRQLEAKLA